MKIKSLLIGMLACTALAGCSDDVIEGGSLENQGDKVYGHLTVSFSANGNSSRSTADDANNKGDQDGNQEHSGHINVGTAAENAVNDALVVIMNKQQGKDGWAGYFKVEKGDGQTTSEGNYFEAVGSNDSKFYTTGEPIVIPAGDYEVLVVANPYSETLGTDGFSWPADKQVTDYTKVKALYDQVVTGAYTNAATITAHTQNYAGKIISTESNSTATGEGDAATTTTTTSLKGIMMVNKSSSSVTVASNHTETNPAVATVDIERVASKITFRETNENWYEVEVPVVGKVTASTTNITLGGKEKTVNLATYKGKDVYVLIENNTYTLYEKNAPYNEIKPTGDETFGPGNVDLVFIYDENEEKEPLKWWVKLEQVALVNLSKSVYHARHIAAYTDAAQKWEETGALPFGQLTGQNFLWTPNWGKVLNNNVSINGVTFWNATDDGFDATKNTVGGFKNIDNTDAWFYNTLQDVSDESNEGIQTNTSFYTSLKSSGWSSVDDMQEVEQDEKYTDGEHVKVAEGTEASNPEIGYLLAYCLENSTNIENQTHGLSTGVSFKASIYADKNGTEISELYRYAGNLFESVDAIYEAYGVNENPLTAPAELLNLQKITSPDRDDLLAAGITPYNSNICYYYTTEIKHFDNGKPEELGNMEFAIMRNNIYSLAVTDINIIGDPWVDPVPNIPDEHPKRNAVVVEAKIMPWIVRYHDIEF